MEHNPLLPHPFLQKAQEGGWNTYPVVNIFLAQYLLDPEVWKAVGRVMGWNEVAYKFYTDKGLTFEGPEWLYHQHQFINLLAQGKSMDEALQEILNHHCHVA